MYLEKTSSDASTSLCLIGQGRVVRNRNLIVIPPKIGFILQKRGNDSCMTNSPSRRIQKMSFSESWAAVEPTQPKKLTSSWLFVGLVLFPAPAKATPNSSSFGWVDFFGFPALLGFWPLFQLCACLSSSLSSSLGKSSAMLKRRVPGRAGKSATVSKKGLSSKSQLMITLCWLARAI